MTTVNQACTLIERWTGFELRDSAPRRIKEFLERRASALGYSSLALYIEDLRIAAPTDAEPQRLINLVTNGSTVFWRDEPQLQALRAALQNGFSEPRDGPIRIWCAGCSTGEEAYTVAMIADEIGVDVHVRGTDINTEFLQHAAVGIYDSWSLRRLSTERRERFIEKRDERGWAVIEPLLVNVEFERHNLLDNPLPGRWDIILCRNVLIYHSDQATERITENFASALSADGFLLLGSSEQLSDPFGLFRASRHGGGFIYRHARRLAGSTMPIPMLLAEDETPPALESSLEEETIDVGDDDVVFTLLNTGVEHLEARHVESALACFEAASAYDPFVPDTHTLLAMTLEASGAGLKAVEAYQKALFLNPYHWFSAYQLATLHEQHGDVMRARQAFRQAIEGLAHTERLFDTRLRSRELSRVESHRQDIRVVCETALARLR